MAFTIRLHQVNHAPLTSKSYCLDKFHREDDGTVSWKCEDCAPNNPKCGSVQLKKSKRISDATEAKYNRKEMQKESGAVRKQNPVKSSECESAECLRKNDINKGWLILEDENVLQEEPESPKGPLNSSPDQQALECEKYADSDAIMPQLLSYPEFDKCSRAQPLSHPLWTGQFRMNKATHFGLVAYTSSKACSKVHSVVTELPRLLDVEMLLRRAIWPENFDMFSPNSDDIAVYFFPQYERDETVFDGVLNDVIEQDLALKAVINNVELLIFSSHLLPPYDRRICDKYYMWGVFKTKPRSGNTQSN
ncbi:uncharacterized protein LOC133288709 isoform X2 [Gastrolobium bilobum]|uniref:uncharacterized protein LOC133288709 isoform X2 n=1 Tax=Gastrolobium bilobum TaxID=150636 RepID=UPI002AB2A08F|nr:uncharacterized protein LOC133288709 isoform X2 [Gastrolobium bilobum]